MRIANLSDVVRDVLTECEEARNSDIALYIKVFEKFGYSTDLNDLKKQCYFNIFESVSRARRKCVESNPSLAATTSVNKNRKLKEEEIKEWNRNSL